jgi:hypothetical protein
LRIADTGVMDTKNAVNSLIPLQTRVKSGVDKAIKTENTTERDGNGQQQYQSPDKKKEPMTEEEFEQATALLKTFGAITEHKLIVEVVREANRRWVLIKESDGTVLRRVQEEELANLMMSHGTDPKKGQLISKTA